MELGNTKTKTKNLNMLKDDLILFYKQVMYYLEIQMCLSDKHD